MQPAIPMDNKLKCILLVDDDHATNFIHKRLLNNIECSEKIVIHSDAREALQIFKENIDFQERPILVMLDINMPEMSGWEFLDEFNNLAEKKKKGVKIAMVTTSINPDDMQLAKSKNADYYLCKPLKKEEINHLVQEITSQQIN